MERVGTVIIGGGVVGLAVARELALRGERDLFLLEKEPHLGTAQSGRSSGVIHAGVYYAPGSLKARLCVEGNERMYAYGREHDVACLRTGKLIVATDDDEARALDHWLDLARLNGVPGVRRLEPREVAALEPSLRVSGALLTPTTGIVDAASLVDALAREARSRGVEVLRRAEVTRIATDGDGFALGVRYAGAAEERSAARRVINCAGLHCDRVARMLDPESPWTVAPLRGEYYVYDRRVRPDVHLAQHNVYPVPSRIEAHGRSILVVGVHLTPTFGPAPGGGLRMSDTVTVGPEFSAIDDRADYASNRLPADHFLDRARRFLPGLRAEDLRIGDAGIMACLPGGGDFVIERHPRHPGFLNLVGIDSPGLTASLALARHVADGLAT